MTDIRRTGRTSAATLLGLALAVVLAHVVAPDWTQRVGLDAWNLPGLMASARASDRDAVNLQSQEDQLLREIELADHLAQRLVAGSTSLEAATAELEPILKNRTGFAIAGPLAFHTPTVHLATARYLIARVEREDATTPLRRVAVMMRLEAEYARMK